MTRLGHAVRVATGILLPRAVHTHGDPGKLSLRRLAGQVLGAGEAGFPSAFW